MLKKLFGSRKEPAKPAPDKSAYQRFAADFRPEVKELMVITGTVPFRSEAQDSGLWEGGIGLTAWTEQGSPDIQLDPVELVILAEEELVRVVRDRLPINFILKLKARLSMDGTRLLLVDLPSPAFDPDLKELLEEQKKPVTTYIEDLGTFTLSHAMGWFEMEHDWLWVGQTVQLTFDADAERKASTAGLKAILADVPGWNGRILSCAAGALLERLNRSLAEDGEAAMDENGFMEAVQVESIQMGEDGTFTAVLNDGGLFYGSSIVVTGSLTDGPTAAEVDEPEAT